MRVVPLLALAAFGLTAGVASAQEPSWGLHLNPRVGYFTPDKALGSLAPEGPVVRMQSASTIGLAMILRTPWRWLDGRATVERTIDADLYTRNPSGVGMCRGEDCSGKGSGTTPLAHGTSILNMSVGLAFHPIQLGSVEPYILGGVGLKRYDLGNGTYDEDFRYRFGGREAALAWHGGVGVAVPVGHVRLTLEAIDYMSGLTGSDINPPPTRPYERSLAQSALNSLKHDVFFEFGVDVPLFGRK